MISSGIENISQFLSNKLELPANGGASGMMSFGVFDIKQRMITGATSPTFIRRDFYKIMLYRGKNTFHYADKSIPVDGSTLLFFNPRDPYTYDALQANTTGSFCVFREEFLKEFIRVRLEDQAVFTAGSRPVFPLDQEQEAEVVSVFEKMQKEAASGFTYKYELIRSYLLQLIYYGLKLSPVTGTTGNGNASARIAAVFTELLERQFPIENTAQRFALRMPKDFADRLAIHVNYLNRAVKNATGKTTSEHIAARLLIEAKALLRYTDWNVSEIAYALGFEEPAHFTNFFRKHTGKSPVNFRQV